MAVVVEILLTPEDLPLVELAGSIPSEEILIENAAVLENKQYFLVANIEAGSHDEFEDQLDDRDEIIDWTPVGQMDDRRFYWLVIDNYPSLYDAYDPTQVNVVPTMTMVTAEGGVQRLLFSDHDEFDKFQRRCDKADIPFQLLTISSSFENPERSLQSELTDRQYEALTVAFSEGYYDSPRRVSTKEIAKELGVSAPAVSKLLQRAERRLVKQAIEPEHRIK